RRWSGGSTSGGLQHLMGGGLVVQNNHRNTVAQAAQQRLREHTKRIHRDYGILSEGSVTNDVGHLLIGCGIRLHQESAFGEVSVIDAGIEDQKRGEDQRADLPQDQDQKKRQNEQKVIRHEHELFKSGHA